jgi:hypothetical protein
VRTHSNDDWFTTPTPEPTLHELYTRRLTAWGYLTKRGETAWDRPVTSAFCALLEQEYSSHVIDMLNQQLVPGLVYGYGNAWKRNPEGPA